MDDAIHGGLVVVMTVANDGRVVDITDFYREHLRRDIEASIHDMDVAELLAIHANDRRFRVYCGGCPYAADSWISQDVLSDELYSAGYRWVVMLGFQANPIRCPYCTGERKRPDDPAAETYPVLEAI